MALFRSSLSSLNLPIPVLQLSHTQPLTLPERWSCSRTTLLVMPAIVLFEQIGHSKGSSIGLFFTHFFFSALLILTPSSCFLHFWHDGLLTDLLFFAFWFFANSAVLLSLWQILQIFLEKPSPAFSIPILVPKWKLSFQKGLSESRRWRDTGDFQQKITRPFRGRAETSRARRNRIADLPTPRVRIATILWPGYFDDIILRW